MHVAWVVLLAIEQALTATHVGWVVWAETEQVPQVLWVVLPETEHVPAAWQLVWFWVPTNETEQTCALVHVPRGVLLDMLQVPLLPSHQPSHVEEVGVQLLSSNAT